TENIMVGTTLAHSKRSLDQVPSRFSAAAAAMSKLRLQRRLVSSVFRCGKEKVWLDPIRSRQC
ncbi:hypothetical protein P7K49_037906, partial [Saguinus oedipus]